MRALILGLLDQPPEPFTTQPSGLARCDHDLPGGGLTPHQARCDRVGRSSGWTAAECPCSRRRPWPWGYLAARQTAVQSTRSTSRLGAREPGVVDGEEREGQAASTVRQWPIAAGTVCRLATSKRSDGSAVVRLPRQLDIGEVRHAEEVAKEGARIVGRLDARNQLLLKRDSLGGVPVVEGWDQPSERLLVRRTGAPFESSPQSRSKDTSIRFSGSAPLRGGSVTISRVWLIRRRRLLLKLYRTG